MNWKQFLFLFGIIGYCSAATIIFALFGLDWFIWFLFGSFMVGVGSTLVLISHSLIADLFRAIIEYYRKLGEDASGQS